MFLLFADVSAFDVRFLRAIKNPVFVMEAPGQMALQRVCQHRSVSGRSEAHSNAPAMENARELRIRQHHMTLAVKRLRYAFMFAPPFNAGLFLCSRIGDG